MLRLYAMIMISMSMQNNVRSFMSVSIYYLASYVCWVKVAGFTIILCLYTPFVFSLSFKSQKLVVSGPSPYLAETAREISRAGGNIFDAAVAGAFTLSVTNPYFVSLGAGGFALMKGRHRVSGGESPRTISKRNLQSRDIGARNRGAAGLAGTIGKRNLQSRGKGARNRGELSPPIWGLDFREFAPMDMKGDFYIKSGKSSRVSGGSVAVPGFVAGMWAIHRRYGSLSWARVLQPAIRLAERGFIISGDHYDRTNSSKNKFNKAGRNVFFHKGKSYLPGERLRQPGLALALRLLKKGKSVFYRGLIGRDIVRVVQKHGGVMRMEDLHKYRVRWLDPIRWDFGGYQFYSMPLPSSGGIILFRATRLMEQVLALGKHNLQSRDMGAAESRRRRVGGDTFGKHNLQSRDMRARNRGAVTPLGGVDEWHLLAEVLSAAFRPRDQMGDLPDATKLLERWLSVKDLDRLARKISFRRILKLPALISKLDLHSRDIDVRNRGAVTLLGGETTHFSMMDDKGQVVSMTLSLNSSYGSYVVTNRYGIVLNNQMDDFNTHPGRPNQFGLIQGKNNLVRAHRRPLSSMSPTIVEKDGRVVLALGAAGGPMIISAVFQVCYRYLIQGLGLDQAVQFPRVHHQFLPRVLYVDKDRFAPLVLKHLKRRGHILEQRDFIGRVMAVGRRRPPKGSDGAAIASSYVTVLQDSDNRARNRVEVTPLLEGAFDARGEGAVGGF